MEEKKRPTFLGFLTGLESADEGIIGGFLILNMVGRPIEFHCTAPVRPNRAQEILFGNTLEGFVCGEQIAPALIGRTKMELTAVLTNNPRFLTAPHLLKVPLGVVFSHFQNDSIDKERYALWDRTKDRIKNEEVLNKSRIESSSLGDGEQKSASSHDAFFSNSLENLPFVPGVDYSLWRETVRGKNHLALPASYKTEDGTTISFDEIVKRIDPFLKFIDSVEPFERIRLAVEEAQKSC